MTRGGNARIEMDFNKIVALAQTIILWYNQKRNYSRP